MHYFGDWAIRDMPICDHCGEPCVAVLVEDMWIWRHLTGGYRCHDRRLYAYVEGTSSVKVTIRHTTIRHTTTD